MALSAGMKLGPYEILSALGAGGMGEVYRARDTRLARMVAVKILPEHLSSNPQLQQRFQREARAISSLSHPHICLLYDIGHENGVDFLVMEYLEGDTLDHRIKKGPLPLEQVLEYAIEITDALDTAHRHGVIHRDLKPSNIMLTRTGAKLLDFGLAKMRAAEAAVAGMTALPTQTKPLTGERTILGTLQYMAPEQLEGAEADARTDIFTLGAVIYEMATGRKAFAGKSQASLISAIMSTEPPLISTITSMASPVLDHVVRICLAKEPEARWQTAHDVLVELKWLTEAGSQAGGPEHLATRHFSHELLPWTLLVLVSFFAATLSVLHFRQPPPEAHTVRFQVPLPDKMFMELIDFPIISPDGQRLVLPGRAPDGVRHLWLHSLDSLTSQVLPGTEGAFSPFWSPDSRFIAFSDGNSLKRIATGGGPPVILCTACDPRAGDWNLDGVILFSTGSGFGTTSGIRRVSAAGGEFTPVLQLDKSRQETDQLAPRFLPDRRHFIYLSRSADSRKSGIYLASLDSKETRMLLANESNASYVSPGYLIYGRQETLLAQPFDSSNIRLSGEAVPIAEHVGRVAVLPLSEFSASENGVLVYGSSSLRQVQLAWRNRDGARQASISPPGLYSEIRLSPDETRLVVTRINPETGTSDLWTLELATGILSRLTSRASEDAQWSPDSQELVFSSSQKGHLDLYRKVVGGSGEELVFQSEEDKWASQWLKDNSVLLVNSSGRIFYRVPLSGGRKAVTVLNAEFENNAPVVSSDGHWVAYQSVESGRWEVYLAAFPSFTARRQVSNGGGCQPHWRKDGKELFYLSLDGKYHVGRSQRWIKYGNRSTASLISISSRGGPIRKPMGGGRRRQEVCLWGTSWRRWQAGHRGAQLDCGPEAVGLRCLASRTCAFPCQTISFGDLRSTVMTSVPVLQELLEYNYWARDRQLKACAELSTEEFIRPLGNSFPSLRDTLTHMLGAEWLWLERWNGRFPRAMLTSSEFSNVASIEQRWHVVERNMRHYLSGLSEDSLSRPITYTNMKGENWTYPLWRMLFHLINHQTYHRGQVTPMLRQIGAEPKPVDFLIAHDLGFQALPVVSKA